MAAASMTVNGVECFVTRSGYTGEDGFEIGRASHHLGLGLALGEDGFEIDGLVRVRHAIPRASPTASYSPTSPRPLLGRPTPVLRAYQVCRRARGLRTTWSRCGTPCSPSLRSRRWGWARATRSVSRRASSLDLAYISPRSSLDLPCSVTRRTSPTPTARPNPHLNPDPNPRPSPFPSPQPDPNPT